MKQKLWVGMAVGLMLLGMSGVAGATLVTIGTAGYGGNSYKLIWEANNNGHSLVWLDYTNAGDIWGNQQAWANGLNGVLSYNLNPGYSVNWGGNSWRLPATVDGPIGNWGYNGTTTSGYNITSSEMGHLFYTELGNKGFYDTAGNSPQAGWGLTSVGDFSHLTASWYWSGTEYADYPSYYAWDFGMDDGGQFIDGKYDIGMDGLAVRSGQVTYSGGATPTPEPATILLLGTGLAGLIGGRMKRRRGLAA